jgi:hypothetical protein
MVAQDGPRLIGFGISQTADHSHLTRTGMIAGTPNFMSTEQAEGLIVGASGG